MSLALGLWAALAAAAPASADAITADAAAAVTAAADATAVKAISAEATAASARLARNGIEVLPSPHWTPGELGALAAALDDLPEGLRRFPGGPLQLARRAVPADFGMGGWEDGRRRFVLGDLEEPASDRRAWSRLGALTDAQREALWRRRAMVHAIVQRWDDALRISARPAWRRISGWLRPFERPFTLREEALATWDFAYSRRLGQSSASLDLVTFAEEALVPVEALAPGALAADEQVRCQEFSRWRVLFGALADGGLLAADAARFERGHCPAFDAFLDRDSLSHAEVLYVAASGRAPESLFGHVLLRLQRRDGERVRGPGFETAIQLVALTGADKPDLRYVRRGVFGGFQMGVLTGPMGELWHQVTENEGRSIRRFRLALRPEQLERLVERAWELERRGYHAYWFFSDNCASLAAFLVQGVLDDDVELDMPPRFSPVLPAAVLDALARAGVLEPSGGTFESMRDRAERSLAERERALAAFAARADDADAAALRALHRRLSHPLLVVRRTGWSRLSALTDAASRALDAEAMGALYAYWLHTVRVERAAVEEARAARMEAELATIEVGEGRLLGADDVVADRQRLFEREAADERQIAALDRLALAEYLLERAPRRALTDAEREIVASAEALAGGFRELTSRHGDAVERHFTGIDPAGWLAADEARRAGEEEAWARRAMRASGYAKLAVGAAMTPGPDGGAAGLVALETAALHEELGDQRVHGFRATSEMRVMSGRTLLRPRLGLPEVVHADLTLWSYRTLQQALPVFRRTPQDGLGWGFRLGWDADAERPEPHRLSARIEALVRLQSSPSFHRFTALGVGAVGQARFRSARDVRPRPSGGPALTVLHRQPLGDDLADALRLEAHYLPAWGAGGLRHELAAAATVDVRVRTGARGFIVRPGAGGTWERGVDGADRYSARAFLLVERLRL